MEDDDPLWGPHSARFNLAVAKEAFRRLEGESFKNGPAWYLYFSSTIIFSRAAIDALREADGKRNKLISEEWANLFESQVRRHPVFTDVIDAERDRQAHGKLEAAIHPQWPLDTVFRHGGLEAISSAPAWPDGHFKSRSIDDVLEVVLRQVSSWIDEIDARSSRRRQIGS